ncbi:zinc-binding dehydrogenase [Paraburkholderia phenoliruptrix]|uniref:zinc-binding dehydrogenase n=1 Tax=Paraburkholderia phenoliruptrix TaxID=252970 RepID=UPI001CB7715A|nr:zinc-binding dehydrogenase [Paraburkholderia phenoliruptrix]
MTVTERWMKAWRLAGPGGALTQKTVRVPEARAGSVRVRIEASGLMSYLQRYVEGKLPFYAPPQGEFTIGTNGVGVIDAVGRDVWHVKPGDRVIVSSHVVARENVREPGQALIGLTAGTHGQPIVEDWPDGTLAEYALAPVDAVTPLTGLDAFDSAQLCALSRFVVPFGGLLRGRLAAGESIVVSGASGAYGTAAVLLALAMGAARVVAAGRNRAALDALAQAGGDRVRCVALCGKIDDDARAIRAAAGGAPDLAFDMLGNAADPNATLAALNSLRRGGRLVLMGSMTVDLPIPYTQVMLNDWEILGQFMYPRDALRRLIDIVRSGLLDLRALRPVVHGFAALPDAMRAAAAADSLSYVVVQP